MNSGEHKEERTRRRSTYRSPYLPTMFLVFIAILAWVWFSDGSWLALMALAASLIALVVLFVPKVSIYEKQFHYRNVGFTNQVRWRGIYDVESTDTRLGSVCHLITRDGTSEPVFALSSLRLVPGGSRNRRVITELRAEVAAHAPKETAHRKQPDKPAAVEPYWKYLGWRGMGWLILAIVMGVMAVFILVIVVGRSEVQLDRSHATATAKVTAVNPGGRNSPGSLDVTFAVGDQMVRTSVQQPYLGPSYSVGQSIQVQYLPSDPYTARIAGQHDALQVVGYVAALVLFVAIGTWFSDRSDRYSKGPRRKNRWA